MHREKIICRIPRSKPALDSKMESTAYLVFFLLKIWTMCTRNVIWDEKLLLKIIVLEVQEGGVELGTPEERHSRIQVGFYWRRI